MTGTLTTAPVDLRDLYDAQRGARWRVAATSPMHRRARLLALMDALMARRPEARAALAADFRKAPEEVDLTEIYPVLSEIRTAIRKLDAWMRPRKVRTPLAFFGSAGTVVHEPKGVVLIISPWNYPLFLTLGPLVSALAAGNCCVIKPSEFTPHTAAFVTALLTELFPREEVAVVEGGADTAQALLDLPFDHVFFTGSPAVGRLVMAAAARNLTPLTLELGGKSPVLVDADADPEEAARKIVWGKFINAGQTCVAPDYVLAHAAVHDRLVEALGRAVRRAYGDTPEARKASPDFARIIHEGHLARLRRLLETSGGDVVLGGEADPAENYLAPTLLTGVSAFAPLMQEEIFGPILPVLKVAAMDEAVQFVNARPKPLALYVFSGSKARAKALLARTTSGGACINDTVLHFAHPCLPAGGVGTSGFGKAHGHHGFLAFSNEKAVLRQRTRFSPIQFMYPPYTGFVRWMVDLTLKYFLRWLNFSTPQEAPMVQLSQLWLPVLVAAVFVFVASSLVHMVLKWHNADYRPLTNEAEVMEAIRKGTPAPGQYLFPHCADHKLMKTEEMQKKYRQGPMGLLYLSAPGLPNMGKSMGSWFLYNVVVAFFVAYLVSRTVPGAAPYLRVFRIAGTAAFLAYAMGAIPGSIWMGKPWKVTLKEVADGLIYALVTAGAFGWLWPR